MVAAMMRWLPWLLAAGLAVEVAALAVPAGRRGDPPLPAVRFSDGAAEAAIQARYQEALGRYRASGDPADLLAIADLLLAYGHQRDAALVYRHVARAHAPQPRAWFGLAMCLDGLGDLDRALEAYRGGIARDPAEPLLAVYRHRVGELLQMRGDVAAAMEAFTANREHPPSRCRLIRLLLRAGERGRAAAEFDRLLADPDLAMAMELQQINDLSLRLHGAVVRPLPAARREMQFAYQPADLQQIAIEDRYGITVTGLIAERLGEASAAAAPAEGPVDAAAVVADPRASERGRALFAATSCAVCHGQEAYGALGPNLRDDFWLGTATFTAICRTIAQGRPGSPMPGHASLLRADQIRDLAAFIVTLNRATPKQEGRTASGMAAQGTRQIVRDE
jgi:mono/diheme cytochrome c family protein